MTIGTQSTLLIIIFLLLLLRIWSTNHSEITKSATITKCVYPYMNQYQGFNPMTGILLCLAI